MLKPAEQTPLTAILLGELILEAGFGEGVVNIVTGDGEAGAALVEHDGVDKVSFTGSTEVGKAIIRAPAGNLKRVTLELGGKSPVVIFPDADLDRAIDGAASGIFVNSGQVCVANSRLFAHQEIFDQVVDGIADRARRLKVGPGIDADSEMGPLVSQEQFERVSGYLESGVADGARAVAGGKPIDRPGYFVEPTVLTGTNADMKIMREEIFGPVDRVVARSTPIWTGSPARPTTPPTASPPTSGRSDIGTAHRMASKLKAGHDPRQRRPRPEHAVRRVQAVRLGP